ncbi:hypothetical protein GCM10020331_062450 [Ectobacillus funiculus]
MRFFPDYAGEKVVIQGKLSALVERLKEEKREAVVLASGDPLFYGIGSYLARELAIEVYPYVSSIQLAFAKNRRTVARCVCNECARKKHERVGAKIDGKEKNCALN